MPLLVLWPALLTLTGVLVSVIVRGWPGLAGLLSGAVVGTLVMITITYPAPLGGDGGDLIEDGGPTLIVASVALTLGYAAGVAFHHVRVARARQADI